MYSTIHRTGLSGGRVYNWTGDNLTDFPSGAGNDLVGPWALDYAAFGTTGDEDVRAIFLDSEFSGVIIDGRGMQQSTSDADTAWPDFDEDEGLDDSRSVVKNEVTKRATVTNTLVRVYHTGVVWDDARVWTLLDDGTVGPAEPIPLNTWLDLQQEGAIDGVWHPLRHALRVPVMWAIYHCPLKPRYPGLTEMISQQTPLTVAQSDLLAWGPAGMLRGMYGNAYAASAAIRLHEAAVANFRPVERGMFMMPYDSSTDDRIVDPDDTFMEQNFIDQMTTQGGPLPIQETTDVQTLQNVLYSGNRLDTPSQRARGRIYTTVMSTSRNMSASPKRITVWHWATCPVRLARLPAAAGGIGGHTIIGGLTSPFEGPPVRIVYHECTVNYRAR